MLFSFRTLTLTDCCCCFFFFFFFFKLHGAHIQTIKKKAESENTKVDEVAFIKKLRFFSFIVFEALLTLLSSFFVGSAEDKKFQIQKKLEESSERRQEYLEERKQRLQENAAKEEAAQERRKYIEMQVKRKHKQTKQRKRAVLFNSFLFFLILSLFRRTKASSSPTKRRKILED